MSTRPKNGFTISILYECFYLLSIIGLHTVIFFQVLLFNPHNTIKYQSFVHVQLNDEIILFQAIQLSISHLIAPNLNVKVHSLNVKQFLSIYW